MSAVRVDEQGPVLVMTLDRPEVMNAVDGALTRDLGAVLERLEDDARLRVGVITGAGPAFCAGLDMKAVAAGAPIAATRHPEHGFAGITARPIGKPLVAALNGAAVGGGLEIALACDLIIAAEGARLGLPEVRHGVFAAGGGVARLARQLPERVASELLLAGRLMSAAEAREWGLVNAVVPEADVLGEALRTAREIAANAPLAVRATKRVLAAVRTDPHAAAISDEEAGPVFASEDAAEGIAAFAERRRPRFTGH